jgi:hypothetical protein
MPGFRVRPPNGVPGFNIDENGSPSGAEAQTEVPYPISLSTPGTDFVPASAPPIGVAGVRVDPQYDVPGFNVRPWDDLSSFNPDEDTIRQHTTWSEQTQTPSPDVEEPTQPPAPSFPEWVYKLINMLPRSSIVFAPIIGPRAALDSLRGMRPNAPQSPTDPSIHARVGNMQNTNFQPSASGVVSTVWPLPKKDGWPYDQRSWLQYPWFTARPLGLPSGLATKPIAASGFIRTNGGSAGEQQATDPLPLQQDLSTKRSVAPGLGSVAAYLPGRPRPMVAEFERGRAPLAEAYRLPEEVRVVQTSLAQPVHRTRDRQSRARIGGPGGFVRPRRGRDAQWSDRFRDRLSGYQRSSQCSQFNRK